MNNIKEQIFRFLQAKKLTKIFVGFSGGADSTALLVLLKEPCYKLGINLCAVHFEHGLRGPAGKEDAGWCRHFCHIQNVKYIEYSLNIQNKSGIESVARQLRYEKFEQLVTSPDSEAVALGHHKGDKIENLFLRLIRGGNTSSLTSLRQNTTLNKLQIIRPLLNFTKNEIKELLISEGITDWREDHTNRESNYNRNFFRNEIIERIYSKIPGAELGIEHSIENIQTDAEYIESVAKEKVNNHISKENLNIGLLLSMHDAVLVRFLRHWLSAKLGYEFIPDRNFIHRLKNELTNKKSGTTYMPLKNNRFLSLTPKSIMLKPNNRICLPELNWDWKKLKSITFGNFTIHSKVIDKELMDSYKKPGAVFFNYKEMPNELILRTWQHGDKIIPFSKNSPVKLKKIFSEKKISACDKNKFPILCLQDNTIIWITNIKRSNFALVTDESDKIIILYAVKNS